MSLAGRLEDAGLPELLQFLSLNKKTGKLTLVRRNGDAVVVIRSGRIVYAASNCFRETFGNILVCRGLIDEATLLQALERQSLSEDEKRLGTILIEMGRVTKHDLEEVMRHQTGIVLSELFSWNSGFFKFEAMEIPERGEIEVDARDFVASEGFSTDRLLLEAAARLDESGQASEQPATTASPPRQTSWQDEAQETAGAASAEAPASLQTIARELRSPALRGEISLMLLRYATQVVNRGVLMMVRGDELSAIGHFGFGSNGASPNAPVSKFRLRFTEPSVWLEVVERKASFKGPLTRCAAHDPLVAALGGGWPKEIIAIPMIIEDCVAMLLYGDNLPENRPIGPIDGLEFLVTEAGLGMEKQHLEAKLRHFELTRRHG